MKESSLKCDAKILIAKHDFVHEIVCCFWELDSGAETSCMLGMTSDRVRRDRRAQTLMVVKSQEENGAEVGC